MSWVLYPGSVDKFVYAAKTVWTKEVVITMHKISESTKHVMEELSPTPVKTPVTEAYKNEVIHYENASKFNKKNPLLKETETRYRDVSKAFVVLSDDSRRKQMTPAPLLQTLPRSTDKGLDIK
ncbi:hypothetical protein Bbelb_117560 [Branchiostoma belcheri]|nr:hypothetical protein Bbelb_117560 [Branchiostoma belcheri]